MTTTEAIHSIQQLNEEELQSNQTETQKKINLGLNAGLRSENMEDLLGMGLLIEAELKTRN